MSGTGRSTEKPEDAGIDLVDRLGALVLPTGDDDALEPDRDLDDIEVSP